MDLFSPHELFFPFVEGRIRPLDNPPNLSISPVLVNLLFISPGANIMSDHHDFLII